jgi:protein angel
MFNPEFCKTGQIGLVAVLRHKMTKEAIIIATTHLVFNPYRGDWKMKQALHLMAEVNNQINKLRTYPNRNSRVPVIICGDLNSSPSSPLISYFKKSEILINRLECFSISGQKPPKFNNYYKKKHSIHGNALLTASNFYKSGLDPTTSSYSDPTGSEFLEPEVEESDYTIIDNYEDEDENDNYIFKISKGQNLDLYSAYSGNEGPTTVVADGDEAVMECLDYIFYSKNNLNLISRLELPVEYQYLPNSKNGSDHLSLSADFAFY